MIRALLFAVIIVGATLPGSIPAQAADSLRMTVRPGLDGQGKLGTWLPVEVSVANTGPDLVGEVQVHVNGVENRGAFNRPPVVYSVPVVLPRQSSKRLTIDVYFLAPIESVSARLVAGGATIASADAPFVHVGNSEFLCGVLAGNRNSFDFLATIEVPGHRRPIRIARLDPFDVPAAPQALASLDCLILNNISLTDFNDAQRSALKTWTMAGGLLIVGGGGGWQKTFTGLPPNFLPVQVDGTATLRSATALSAMANQPVEDPGPWLITRARPTDGSVMIDQEGIPVLIGAQRGQGTVLVLAFDPTLEPLRSWSGSSHLWRYMLAHSRGQLQVPNSFVRAYQGFGRIPRNVLADLSQLPPPTLDWLPYLLGGYALIIGPLAYVALRRFGRLELGVFVVPAAVVGATGIALGLSSSSGGADHDVLLNKISVIRSWNGGEDGYARTYVGVFSPRAGTYDIETANTSLVQSLFYPFPMVSATPSPGTSPVEVSRAEKLVVRDFTLDARSLGTFIIDTSAAVGTGASVHANLVITGDRLHGMITNRYDRPVTESTLIVGSDLHRLGTLEPGQTRAFDAAVGEGSPVGLPDTTTMGHIIQPLPASPTPVPTPDAMRREIVNSVLAGTLGFSSRLDLSPITLVGWLDEAPVDFTIADARVGQLNRTLLIATLPATIEPGQQTRIPPALIEQRNLIPSAVRIQNTSLTVTAGETLQIEYYMPVRSDLFNFQSVGLVLEGGTPTGLPLGDVVAATVFDWQTLDWVEVPVRLGLNDLGDPRRVVSTFGMTRVRMNYRAPNSAGSVPPLTFDRFQLDVVGRGR